MTKGKRFNLRKVITETIVAALKAGTVPWQRGWVGGNRHAGLLAKTGRCHLYRGINLLLCAIACYQHGWGSHYWLTWKRVQGMGGSLKPGVTFDDRIMIVFWSRFKTKDKDADGESIWRATMKYYRVWNLDQIDGITVAVGEEVDGADPVEAADKIISTYTGNDGPEVYSGGSSAYYLPVRDEVHTPPAASFHSTGEYYGTLYHELIHSTGHKDRCDRGLNGSFGTDPYAREELVAEIGSCYMLAESGIEREYSNSAAYLASWIKRLEDDPGLITQAAQQAAKASDCMLGVTYDS